MQELRLHFGCFGECSGLRQSCAIKPANYEIFLLSCTCEDSSPDTVSEYCWAFSLELLNPQTTEYEQCCGTELYLVSVHV